MPDRPLTILQLTHQGTGSGSTMVIASLSGELVRRGHRVLVGCRAGTTLASLARGAGLPLVPLDFGRLAPRARHLHAVSARYRVALVKRAITSGRRPMRASHS